MSSVQNQSANKYQPRLQLTGILLIISIAALILLAIWLASFLPVPLNYGVWIGIVLIPTINRCVPLSAYKYRKSQSGIVVINLGFLNKLSGWSVTFSIFLAICWFILWITQPSYEPVLTILQFGVVVFFIIDAAAKFIVSGWPTLVTEKGIYGPESIILWNEIESHQWFMQHEDGLLVVTLKQRPWPLDKKKQRIPASQMTHVEKILQEKCRADLQTEIAI